MSSSGSTKVLYIGDSIAHNCDFQKVSNETGAQLVCKKAYASVYDELSKFKDSNFRNIVPLELSKDEFDILMLHSPSVDITNMKRLKGNFLDTYFENRVLRSSTQFVRTVEHALTNHTQLKMAVIIQQAPRHDGWEWLSDISKKVIHKCVEESKYKDKIKVVSHSFIAEGDQFEMVFGSPATHYNYDGIHLRGPSGRQVFTESIINVFNQVEISNFTNVNEPFTKSSNLSELDNDTSDNCEKQTQFDPCTDSNDIIIDNTNENIKTYKDILLQNIIQKETITKSNDNYKSNYYNNHIHSSENKSKYTNIKKNSTAFTKSNFVKNCNNKSSNNSNGYNKNNRNNNTCFKNNNKPLKEYNKDEVVVLKNRFSILEVYDIEHNTSSNNTYSNCENILNIKNKIEKDYKKPKQNDSKTSSNKTAKSINNITIQEKLIIKEKK